VSPSGVGDAFQKGTSYRRDHMPGGKLDWDRRPAPCKTYPAAPKVRLSAARPTVGAPLWEVLRQRRSLRRYQNAPLQEQELSQLLWAAQGITGSAHGLKFRTAPSAGALYPVETYLVVNFVSDVAPGVYHYAVENHELDQLRSGDFRRQAAYAALDQDMAYRAGVVFIWTAVFERSKWKYGQRAYRYVYLDAGHIAQNVALAAVALGLGSCQIAALYDDEANALVDVDGHEEGVLYMTAVGRPV
jgi:SagB-type dehydrogenase family enzyme